jgi:two-component system, OmpR family, response regulator
MVGQNKGENCAMNKILIIDDDRELCALIKHSVQSEHIEADFCNTGKEGLQKYVHQHNNNLLYEVSRPTSRRPLLMSYIPYRTSIESIIVL